MNKALLQQALDALLEYDYAKTDKADRLGGAAIYALRLAIAQPVLEPAPGYCKTCKDYTIAEPLFGLPVQSAPELPKPYSNIYPENEDDCCHYICYSPSTQPGGGRPNHQPVYTADQMREYSKAATPLPVQSAVIDAEIERIALSNGFKLKEQSDGTMALNSYVFDFARAVIAAASLPVQTERNFCERCGQRLGDDTYIHTCTPPVAATYDSLINSVKATP